MLLGTISDVDVALPRGVHQITFKFRNEYGFAAATGLMQTKFTVAAEGIGTSGLFIFPLRNPAGSPRSACSLHRFLKPRKIAFDERSQLT